MCRDTMVENHCPRALVSNHILFVDTFVTIVAKKALLSPLLSSIKINFATHVCCHILILCRHMWRMATRLDNAAQRVSFKCSLNKNRILAVVMTEKLVDYYYVNACKWHRESDSVTHKQCRKVKICPPINHPIYDVPYFKYPDSLWQADQWIYSKMNHRKGFKSTHLFVFEFDSIHCLWLNESNCLLMQAREIILTYGSFELRLKRNRDELGRCTIIWICNPPAKILSTRLNSK